MAGTVSAGRGGRRGGITGINVTPMVDVVLVLLVIMMVSAIYIVSQSLKVELPKTASSDQAASSPLSVTVQRDGTYLFNEKVIDEDGLRAEFQKAIKSTKEPSLVLTADREAFHGDVVHVIDLAKVEGIIKFAITVDRSK